MKPRPDITPTTDSVTLADAYASELSGDGPAELLARRGVELWACPDALALPGKVVWGMWHPSIRRVELFGCGKGRSDRDIVLCLAHEIWHMDHPGPRSPNDETRADRFARRLLRRLNPVRVAVCARALRRMARPASSASCVKRVSPNPICISP